MDWYRLIPGFWSQQKKTFKAWDVALNRALDEGVTHVGPHEAKVGPFTVWISNWPYSFGYNRDDALEQLPFVKTRMRLRRAVEQWQADRYAEQFENSTGC